MNLDRTLAVFVLLLSTSHAHAVIVSGVVKDKQTSLPVSGAKVTLLEREISGITDGAGKFSLSTDTSASDFADTLVVRGEKYWKKQVSVTPSNTSSLRIELQAAKHRLIITTDIGGGDPDDLQSMIHALLLSNEYELEGIIYGHAWGTSNLERGRERIEAAIDAYGKVLPNLKVHADGYPAPEYLRSIVRQGQAETRMEGVGEGKDSDGSNLIIAAVDKKDDPRPIWLNAWGGANTIAQAYWKVKNSRAPEEIDKFVNKVRVYDILGQCDSGSWIAKNFPDAFYIRNADGVYGWAPSKDWTAENVQTHGPLGAIYPTSKWATEGDSPSFLHVSSRGLNDPDEIAQGGWGGRFGPEKKTGVKLFHWAERNDIVNAHDQKLRPYAIFTNTSEGTDSIRKWQDDIHSSQAARMDWTVSSKYSEANHFPTAVLNSDATRQILQMNVKPDEQVTLNASDSSDPDGNKLKYSWQFYKEASSYRGNVSIQNDSSSIARVTAPSDSSGKNIHIILVVHDDGSPSLAAYRRMIIQIK